MAALLLFNRLEMTIETKKFDKNAMSKNLISVYMHMQIYYSS